MLLPFAHAWRMLCEINRIADRQKKNVGHWLALHRHIRLDGVHQRIDAGCRRDALRRGDGQHRINDSNRRHQVRAADQHLYIGLLVGDYCIDRRLAAGTRSCGNGNDRNARRADFTDPLVLLNRTGVGHQYGDGFRRIDRTATAHRHDKITVALFVCLQPLLNVFHHRFGVDASVDRTGNAAVGQILLHLADQPQTEHNFVGNDQGFLPTALLTLYADLLGSA